MTSQGTNTLTRLFVISAGLVAVIALIAAVVMYGRAQREAHRNRVTAQAMAAWIQDAGEQRKDMPRFLPLARESLALQRTAPDHDPVTLGGTLSQYALMSLLPAGGFWGSEEPAPSVREFQTDVANELADIELDLLARHDPRAPVFLMPFTETDFCNQVRDGKCDKLLLESTRAVNERTKAGDKNLDSMAKELAGELNSRSWDVVKVSGKSREDYSRALEQAEAAAQANPGTQIVHTLALAQYRSGQLEPAAKSIARVIEMRKDARAESIDLVVEAMIDAKAGRTAAARTAAGTVETRRSTYVAEALAKGQKPVMNKEIDDLLLEAQALLK